MPNPFVQPYATRVKIPVWHLPESKATTPYNALLRGWPSAAWTVPRSQL